MIDEEEDVMRELFLKAFNDLENASIVRLGSLDVSPDINNYLIWQGGINQQIFNATGDDHYLTIVQNEALRLNALKDNEFISELGAVGSQDRTEVKSNE